jgi:hypothetical protein
MAQGRSPIYSGVIQVWRKAIWLDACSKYLIRGGRLIWYFLTFLFNFAHGSLLVAGVIVICLVGYQLSRFGGQGLNPKAFFGGYSVSATQSSAATDIGRIATTDAGRRVRLAPGMAKVSFAIAKRHHISPLVAEGLVRIAQNEGAAEGVDPLLILSVITVESGFNPFLESPLGAQGLMQVVPKLHAELIPADKSPSALFDPAVNIHIGTRILKICLDRAPTTEDGLQGYGGASGNPDMNYATHVLQELERFQGLAKPSAVAGTGSHGRTGGGTP